MSTSLRGLIPESRQSSITVAVRVRPFDEQETSRLIPTIQKDSNVDGFPYTIAGSRNNLTGNNSSSNLSFSNSNVTGDTSIFLPNADSSQYDIDEDSNKKPDFKLNQAILPRSNGIWKVVDCVDDKMLIFDPSDRNPLNQVSENVLNSIYSQRRQNRRRRRSEFYNNNSNKNDKASKTMENDKNEIKFVFDKLFDDDSTQEEVYTNTTSPLIESILDGFNATVFAYGATGCGKTYTVSGTPDQPGIIFLAMKELFEKIDKLNDVQNFEISLSYLEIYNEKIRDLLNPDMSFKKLVIREDGNKKTTVANLSYHYPKTVQEVIDLVIKGNINRTTSATEANQVSSRSHAVLQVHIMQTNKKIDLTAKHTYATLSIIDLAGSERAAATKNRGQRLYEGANINRSLLALGNCINALCINDDAKKPSHISYRDSKLTRLLKFSLGGNCKTVMIVCISPSSLHYDETLNTLKYANRAKEIKTKIIRNQQSLNRHVGSYLKMITEQKIEIEELRGREARMIELKLREYKLNNRKIELKIDDIIDNVKRQYLKIEKYQILKKLKSLTLVKRRFLQLVELEVDNVLSFVSDFTDSKIATSCQLIKNQLVDKIRELEIKFDSTDELDLVITHVKDVDLMKLKEMENWDDSIHLPQFENRLDHLSELLRNEIMINASLMIEKLFENQILVNRFKFLSNCLATEQDIYYEVQDLVNIDEEFDNFAKLFLDNSNDDENDGSYVNELSLLVDNNSYDSWNKIKKIDRTASGNMTETEEEEVEEDEKPIDVESIGIDEKNKINKKLRWSETISNTGYNEKNETSISTRQPSDSMDIDTSLQDTTITMQDSLLGGSRLVDTSQNGENTSYLGDRANNKDNRSLLLRRNFLTDDTA